MTHQKLKDDVGSSTVRALARRIVPFLAVLYVISFLDRVNVSFAALTMNADLGISPVVFGWGAGIFFIGYLLCQVPSNLLLVKFGPRRWIAILMVAWGVVSVGMGFIRDVEQFLLARFLLGVAEAGFFPGVILYLSVWFPQEYRARILAGFMFALPIATIVGAPLSSYILSAFHDYASLEGWRWLFILEGAPALLGAIAVWRFLPDRPEDVKWLDVRQRHWLATAQFGKSDDERPARSALEIGIDSRVLCYAVIYFGLALSLYGVGLWLPQMIQAGGVSAAAAALLSGIPYIVAAVGMLIWGKVADYRPGAPTSNIWIPALVATIALASVAITDGFMLQMVLLSLTALGTLAALATFWTVPTSRLPRSETPIAVAVINAIGNMGGFIGPLMVGWVRQTTQSFGAALLSLAACVAVSVVLLMISGYRQRESLEST